VSQLDAHALKLALVALCCIGRNVLEDRVAAQLAADFGFDDQGVGFAFADAKPADVLLHVSLIVIGVIVVIELAAARRLQVVDPSQPVPVDEVGVEAKS
jgi:hypothetical protein